MIVIEIKLYPHRRKLLNAQTPTADRENGRMESAGCHLRSFLLWEIIFLEIIFNRTFDDFFLRLLIVI